jgi:hypothetical protein
MYTRRFIAIPKYVEVANIVYCKGIWLVGLHYLKILALIVTVH